MHAKGIVNYIDLAVIDNFTERLTLFKVAVFDLYGVLIKVRVCFVSVRKRVLLQKKGREFVTLY